MKTYYSNEMQLMVPEKGEECAVKIKLTNQTHCTKWMDLNLDSIESLQALIDILKEDLERNPKQEKVNLVYALGIQCDMINGKLEHMSKEHIDDTWYEEDLDMIIDTAKSCIKEAWKGELKRRFDVFKNWDKEDLEIIIEDCLDAEDREYTEGNYLEKKAELVDSSYLSDIKRSRELVDDPCPQCGMQMIGKGLQAGGGTECSNPKCDYWFCF
ncbi:MAG: hypothetical protein GY797_17725 [Deltaproteobacteria bacterium]|nr:hypothetical protein [Deltaproteobacteria bacterium]